MSMQKSDINSESLKWNKVYNENPDNLPWFGIDFPPEVQNFFSLLDQDGFLLVTGCGAGDTANELKTKGFTQILGTDISLKAIEVAKKRFPSIAFEMIATEEIPLREKFRDVNTFDWLNLHQVQFPEKYLQSLGEVSKNLCIVWIYSSEKKTVIKSYNHEGNIYMHDPEMVKKIIEEGGLKLKKQFDFSFATNPKNKEIHQHKSVGQIYGK